MKRKNVSFPLHNADGQDPSALARLLWNRPVKGGPEPEWIDGRLLRLGDRPAFSAVVAERRWMRLERVWTSEGVKAGLYDPLSDAPEMWRVFVELDESEEAYLEFARRYGALALGDVMVDGDWGVPFVQWQTAHRTMRTAWLVRSAVLARNSKALEAWFAIDAAKGVRFVGEPVPGHRVNWGAYLGGPRLDSLGLWKRFSKGTVSRSEQFRQAAIAWTWRIVNLCMSPPDETVEDSLAGGLVKAYLDLDWRGDLRTSVVRFKPVDLVGAMWLQFAKTIEGNLLYRQCQSASCRHWFLISTEGAGKRRHTLFCSDRCRLREWRSSRKVKAQKSRKGASESRYPHRGGRR